MTQFTFLEHDFFQTNYAFNMMNLTGVIAKELIN